VLAAIEVGLEARGKFGSAAGGLGRANAGDLRAEIGQVAGGHRAGEQAGEVEDADVGQRQGAHRDGVRI
jgi:hypothetical protein